MFLCLNYVNCVCVRISFILYAEKSVCGGNMAFVEENVVQFIKGKRNDLFQTDLIYRFKDGKLMN